MHRSAIGMLEMEFSEFDFDLPDEISNKLRHNRKLTSTGNNININPAPTSPAEVQPNIAGVNVVPVQLHCRGGRSHSLDG